VLSAQVRGHGQRRATCPAAADQGATVLVTLRSMHPLQQPPSSTGSSSGLLACAD
jgi:hypothetical protein